MVSLKTKTRATITTLTVAALATAIFTGCAPSTPSNSDTSDVSSVPGNSSVTASIPENSTPGGSGDDEEGIKFKYWYENNKPTNPTDTDDAATGEILFGSETLPIFEGKDGKKYVGSDFKHISVDGEGNISSKDATLLRDKDDFKIYLMNADAVLKDGFIMPTFEDLQAADLANGSAMIDANATTARLYVNGISVGEISSPSQIDLSSIFSVAANIGAINFKDTVAVVSFGTAVDVITATFTPQDDNSVLVTYSTNDAEIKIPSSAISYNFSSTTAEDNYLRLNPEFIEKTLGYHIISSTTAEGILELNVITDTKDELKEGNTIDPDVAAEHIKVSEGRPNEDNTSKPTESSTPSSSSNPIEDNTSKPTESDPSSSAPSSGKPTESAPTESKPAQSSSTPVTIINPTPADDKPSDTTGIELDANGHPADALAWVREHGNSFVDSSGQLWVYDRRGWRLPSAGGTIADHSDWNIGTDEIIGH